MKRVCTTLICIFFFFNNSMAQKYFGDLFDTTRNSKDIIHESKIRKEMIFSCSFDKGELVDSSLTKINYYDSLGDITSSEQYDPKTQKLRGTNTFVYDSAYKLIKTYFTFANSKLISTTYFEYDSNGNEVKINTYNDTTLILSTIKKYNNKNQQISLTSINNFSYTTGTTNFFYNRDGSIKRKESFNDKNKTIVSTDFYKTKYKEQIYSENKTGRYLQKEIFYNDKNRPAEIIDYYPNGQLMIHTIQITYYTHGTVFEWAWLNNDKKIQANRHYYFLN